MHNMYRALQQNISALVSHSVLYVLLAKPFMGKQVITLYRQRLFYLIVESECYIPCSSYEFVIVNQPLSHHVHPPVVLGNIVASSSQRLLELFHGDATSVFALGNNIEDELGDMR